MTQREIHIFQQSSMVSFYMDEQQNYCTHCGRRLVWAEIPTSNYSSETGKRIFECMFVCPIYKEGVESQKSWLKAFLLEFKELFADDYFFEHDRCTQSRIRKDY